jgi:FkbM family methyltransferase
VHGRDTGITLERCALGESPGEAEIHLSRSRDSSSLLPIGQAQTALFPDTDEVGVLKVPVKRLDDFLSVLAGRSRVLLKLDVQGFELSVLRGGAEALRRCAYVYAECSEVALYEGQALRPEVEAFLASHGFPASRRFNESHADGRLIQADHLFVRS